MQWLEDGRFAFAPEDAKRPKRWRPAMGTNVFPGERKIVTVTVKQSKLDPEGERSFDSGSASAQDDGTPPSVILSEAKDLDIAGSGSHDLYRLSSEYSGFIHGGAACCMGI